MCLVFLGYYSYNFLYFIGCVQYFLNLDIDVISFNVQLYFFYYNRLFFGFVFIIGYVDILLFLGIWKLVLYFMIEGGFYIY